jgi:hypothetical protein
MGSPQGRKEDSLQKCSGKVTERTATDKINGHATKAKRLRNNITNIFLFKLLHLLFFSVENIAITLQK